MRDERRAFSRASGRDGGRRCQRPGNDPPSSISSRSPASAYRDDTCSIASCSALMARSACSAVSSLLRVWGNHRSNVDRAHRACHGAAALDARSTADPRPSATTTLGHFDHHRQRHRSRDLPLKYSVSPRPADGLRECRHVDERDASDHPPGGRWSSRARQYRWSPIGRRPSCFRAR